MAHVSEAETIYSSECVCVALRRVCPHCVCVTVCSSHNTLPDGHQQRGVGASGPDPECSQLGLLACPGLPACLGRLSLAARSRDTAFRAAGGAVGPK